MFTLLSVSIRRKEKKEKKLGLALAVSATTVCTLAEKLDHAIEPGMRMVAGEDCWLRRGDLEVGARNLLYPFLFPEWLRLGLCICNYVG